MLNIISFCLFFLGGEMWPGHVFVTLKGDKMFWKETLQTDSLNMMVTKITTCTDLKTRVNRGWKYLGGKKLWVQEKQSDGMYVQAVFMKSIQ